MIIVIEIIIISPGCKLKLFFRDARYKLGNLKGIWLFPQCIKIRKANADIKLLRSNYLFFCNKNVFNTGNCLMKNSAPLNSHLLRKIALFASTKVLWKWLKMLFISSFKTLFVLEISKFCPDFFAHVGKRLDRKAKFNLRIYNRRHNLGNK